MLFDFFRFLNNNSITSGASDYINCYSSFLISRKDLKQNILKHRINILIDIYLYNNQNIYNQNKFDFINYYLTNNNDSFLNKEIIIGKPPKQIEIDITHDFDSDVKDHYKFITSTKPPEPQIDYDLIDKKFYEEELLKEKEKEEIEYLKKVAEDDYYYDDYEYDDYNDEYDFTNDYDDDYDDFEYK